MGLVPAPIAAAQGDEADPQTLSLRSLGLGNTLSFYGLDGETTLTIPVPVGADPVDLNGTVEMPPTVLRGFLTVTQGDRSIVRMPLPANDLAPITIPLAGAAVVDNSITIQMRATLIPPPEYCLYDPANPLRLTGMSLELAGNEAPPAAVADFLPPVLQRLTIFVPRSPSLVESDAAIRLTAAVVAHYGQQNPEVSVVALDGTTIPPTPPGQFERQIVVKEGPQASVGLQRGPGPMPSLLITGPTGEITNQVLLLTSDLSRLAASAKATVGPLHPVAQIPADLTTIRDLGQPGVNATDLTNPRVTIPLDQTRLGRPVRAVRVHLIGSYTPLPDSLGGQVVVSIADQTVAQWPTESTGSIDRWIDIPEDRISRYTALDVEVQAAGNTGRCGENAPIRLVIDGATAVETALANPPVDLGFQSMPQALMPRVEVGLNGGEEAFANTVRAATIVEGLQHLSARPLDTVAVPFADAVGSPNPAILISATGWDQSAIPLLVSADQSGPITVRGGDGDGGDTTLTLDPTKPFGSLQTVYAGGRTVLVATSNGDAAQLDSLLSWLDQDTLRWSQLDGNVVIAMPGRQPVTVDVDVPQAPAPAGDGQSALWWLGGGLIAVVIAGVLVWTLKRRRSTSG
ncbi:hypothetical protein ACIA48_24375 [Mycobacterium sp. NPDC051804]|uniref:hypothetical protein n=1 Tax=Mycobacterium sp. NPDC051804 TaxID=3364295 RepID=UPI0037AA32E3